MANILNVTAADNGKKFPLRGDMSVAMNFTPADSHFRVSFMTQDTNQYTINSTLHPFRALNLTTQTGLSFGGKIGLTVEFMFEPQKGEWVLTDNNLVSGDAGTGGGTGTAATIAVDSTVTGAPGTPALVENVGTASAVRLKFTVPRGADGADGEGGGGAAFPPGGAVSQYLGKTGTADGQVGWLSLPAGTGEGGGGGTFTPEVLLTQNASGEITPNKALGNAFRAVLTRNGKVMNPVGYQPGEIIYMAIRQGETGPFTLEWDLDWAHPDRQVPVLSNQPYGLNDVSARLTGAISEDMPGGWITEVTPKSSTVGFGVPSHLAHNITTNLKYYFLRSPTSATNSALTSMRAGETVKILRNGIGAEAYGAIDNSNGAGNYLISGAMANGQRAELRTGPGVRPAFDRGVLAFSGTVNVTVQDLILSGAREQGGSHIAQGIALSDHLGNLTCKNVRFHDNENGVLSGTQTGFFEFFDCEFENNSKGDFGYTHNIYAGSSINGWAATRTDFKNSPGGHNVKSRAGITTLNACHVYNAMDGREVDLPNGGRLYATDCIFEHPGNAVQNDCIRIGAEGVITTRPREYIIRNCHFSQGRPSANAASFVWNQDPDVDVRLIDCTFEHSNSPNGTWAGSDANGNVGRVVLETTGGPVGPRVPVGYQPIAVTPV